MSKPRLLTIDIETCPAKGYMWGLFDQNIGLSQLIEPSRVIAVGAHWMGTPQSEAMYWDVWPYTNAAARSKMLRGIHAAMSAADAVVTFNGARFDLPKLNGEFVLADLKPVPPAAHVDVFLTTRKLGYISNKLEYVAPLLGCGHKMPSSFGLWRGYVEGDERCRDKMRRYNIRDVRVLERVYDKVLPFIKHPRLTDRPACPNCGGTHVEHRGYRKTEYFRIERIHCLAKNCGRWFDGTMRKQA